MVAKVNKIIILPKQKDRKGYCNVYVESTAYPNGKRKRKRISTGVKVKPKHWSKSKSLVLSGDPLHEEKNKNIKAFFDVINTSNVTESYAPQKLKSLVDYINDYINYRKALGTKRSSYKEFITVRNRIEKFQKSKGIILTFEDINLRFSDAFIIWHSDNKFDPNTIHKSFVILKTVLYHYFERKEDYNISITDAFQNKNFGKIQTHYSPPLPLTSNEFKRLTDIEYFIKSGNVKDKTGSLERACDAFVFGCSTGLRFSDLFRVSRENIRNNIIYIEPVKTENTKKENLCKIPLNNYSSEILEKYDYDLRKLKLSNQHYNKLLKNLFKQMKFNEKIKVKKYNGLGDPIEIKYFKWELLTSHNARDTFITFAIKVGIDIPSLMEMTGHTNYKTMKKYIKLDDNHLVKSMDKFQGVNVEQEEKRDFEVGQIIHSKGKGKTIISDRKKKIRRD